MESKGTPINRQQLEELIFGGELSRRFTQDSPILPDVWIKYGNSPGQRVDLLLNPFAEISPGKLFHALRDRLKAVRKTEHWKQMHPEDSTSAELAYNQSTVVAKLYFDELIQVVLPLTAWWKNYIIKKKKKSPDKKTKSFTFKQFLSDQKNVLNDLDTLRAVQTSTSELNYPPEWLWMVKVIGKICYAQENKPETDIKEMSDDICFNIFSTLMSNSIKLDSEHESLVWSIALNRSATISSWRSMLAVKADAARLLFNISCEKINWAVIDSGIDATHPSFRTRNIKGALEKLDPKKGDWTSKTRVKATYDFRKMRTILSAINESLDVDEMPDETKKLLTDLFPASDPDEMSFEARVQTLRDALNYGYYANWDVLEPILRIKHDQNYQAPIHEHGTHVAGILAGCWKKDENEIDEGQDLIGVCPDLNLYDLRVLDDQGTGDEFSILGALQFVRYLNSHKEYISVHGVNLSLSIRHDVVNYACGCTPVCEECNRLVNAGTVVVAAAGNQGYLQYLMADGQPTEGYRSISVTDPGNAEGVITVGSTHSLLPHSYGVSYFSSRGPTGDGRIKPDIVAPGEKIKSCIPSNSAGTKDGTSMAAPHVSGAAALLMARHSELLGKPQRVKEILCKAATDLGRERYFQGSGMVDILRAIQSV